MPKNNVLVALKNTQGTFHEGNSLTENWTPCFVLISETDIQADLLRKPSGLSV